MCVFDFHIYATARRRLPMNRQASVVAGPGEESAKCVRMRAHVLFFICINRASLWRKEAR